MIQAREEIKEKRVEELVDLSEQILEQDRKVKEVVDLDFERVIYLGAGPFFGLSHEAPAQDFGINSRQNRNHV